MGRKSLYKTEEEKKEARRLAKQKYNKNHKDKIKEYNQKFYNENKDKITNNQKDYYEKNKETILKKQMKKYINDYSQTIIKKEYHNQRNQVLGEDNVKLHNKIYKIIHRETPYKYNNFKDEYDRLKSILKEEYEKDKNSEETKEAYNNFLKLKEKTKAPPPTEEEEKLRLRKVMNDLVDIWNGEKMVNSKKQLDCFSSSRRHRVLEYLKENPTEKKQTALACYTKAFALYYETQKDIFVKSKDDEEKKINKIIQKRLEDVNKIIELFKGKGIKPFDYFLEDFIDKDGCYLYEEYLRSE